MKYIIVRKFSSITPSMDDGGWYITGKRKPRIIYDGYECCISHHIEAAMIFDSVLNAMMFIEDNKLSWQTIEELAD